MADFKEALSNIDPSRVSYEEWTKVGMAIKLEGYPVSVWDEWSRRDAARYHQGECEKKWRSFNGNADPVTAGTVFQIAKDQGWVPYVGHALEWNDMISVDDRAIIDSNWVEYCNADEPAEAVWDPVQQITEYLNTLFDADEIVGYVTKSSLTDGKYHPATSGSYKRTARQIIEDLSRAKKKGGSSDNAVRDALGDYDENAGAWIRFNPLDGKGIRNSNVTDFRYALIESDNMEIEKQNGIIRELEIPVAALVHSGNKSLHAIVRVDASDIREYKERVNYLYSVCEKNGMTLDKQNRNPSRLSRLPGVMRNGRKQFLVATNIGKSDWEEWQRWIEEVEDANDNLPTVEPLDMVWNDIPPLADALIDGILRKGHKLLLSGPSKAGKSFLLIELCIAIAEGKEWLGRQCLKGHVMYVNLELDRVSCLHRFRDVYEAMGIPPENIRNIDIWNLRGKSVPMDKLAPKLIRRAQKNNYSAVVIDPIYKVITGDENNASEMGKFCNQFDLVCTELECAVIYCHHHSKGLQGQKRSVDRASGSGVFARDPDALLDMIQLLPNQDIMKKEADRAAWDAAKAYLEEKSLTSWDWKTELSRHADLNAQGLMAICENRLNSYDFGGLRTFMEDAVSKAMKRTAWRVEGTLREFPPFGFIDAWFDYPSHALDTEGVLKEIEPEVEKSPYQKKIETSKANAEKERKENHNRFRVAFEGGADDEGKMAVDDLAEAMGVNAETICRWFGNNHRYSKPHAELRKDYCLTVIDKVKYIKKHQ